MLLLKCLELKFQKESDVPEVLEDKNAPEIPKVMTDEVKAAESELLKTRNDLEDKIPKDSEVKTPEPPKAKEAEDQEVDFSENWEVKFPEELEATKTSEVVKVAEESKLPQVSKVSAPKLSQVKVKKEPDLPGVLDDKSGTKVLEVHAPSEVAGIKVSKESDVPEVLEDKNAPEVPKVMTDEVKAAESELLKVSEVTTSEDLETEAPKVFLRH
ncbi:hypothetical protein F2Q70_00010842 [Brassica cretica]|uniref:Uncharacterized protein n=1 Tax=Brassica cretica TaxID=69181 RepID=A0A8S9MAN0_BRACR|nr:hypothetical protein F2Q68_00003938 [Brassica cretica]KAF2614849.1 hypothetical protein F2Q70_00010842 [Brassica cretica]